MNKLQRSPLLAVLCFLISSLFALSTATAQQELLVGTWGGHYEDGQSKVFFKPFEGLGQIKVSYQSHGGNLHKLIAKRISGQKPWDILDLDRTTLEKACTSGFLLSIDHKNLPPGIGGVTAQEDFLDGSIHRCGIAHSVWSKIFAIKLSSFQEKPPPTNLTQLFDIENHPGPRGFFKTAEGLLELALLADGVSVEAIYELLSTKDGRQRAFAKLSSIRQEILWLKSTSQGLDLLKEGKLSIAQGYHNELFSTASNQENGIALLWDHQLMAKSYWSVVAASDHRDKALEFINFATSPGATASQASFLGYGPSRQSAQTLVREDLRPYLPTDPEHLKTYFVVDYYWWDTQGRAAKKEFWDWLRSGV